MRLGWLLPTLVLLPLLAACPSSDMPPATEPPPTPAVTGPAPEAVPPPLPDTSPVQPPMSPNVPDGGGEKLVVSGDACKTDTDCSPSGCCHATACGGKSKAPDCKAVQCSMECRGGTIDCGGGCLCQDGHCAARLTPGGK
ncbi:MAG: hypothetical protein WKG00_01415 [Polyangiaceae bacterium]